jgi:hypothetical protein
VQAVTNFLFCGRELTLAKQMTSYPEVVHIDYPAYACVELVSWTGRHWKTFDNALWAPVCSLSLCSTRAHVWNGSGVVCLHSFLSYWHMTSVNFMKILGGFFYSYTVYYWLRNKLNKKCITLVLLYWYTEKLLASSFLSARPSVLMEQLASHWTDCREIWYLSFFFEILSKNFKCHKLWQK